jgi:hypothetical protein
MTTLLDQAIAELQKRPPAQQDAIASLIFAELEDEARWDAAFAQSQDALSRIAAKVRADIKAGKVRKIEREQL